MSVNIGTAAVEAAKHLRTSEHFTAVRKGLHDLVVAKMNAAIESDPVNRVEATAYARALRDLWLAFEAAVSGVNPRQVVKPGPKAEA